MKNLTIKEIRKVLVDELKDYVKFKDILIRFKKFYLILIRMMMILSIRSFQRRFILL